jgi:hypothetical protein
MTAYISMDKNPVDTLWKAALPAAFDEITALLNRAMFRKRPIFKSYDNPSFRAQWNLTYTNDYADLHDTLLLLRSPSTSDGVLHISNTYSDFVQVSYGFVGVELPHYDDRYQYAISIDLVTWSASRLVSTFTELTDTKQSDALWAAIDLVDSLPRLPEISDYTPLRRQVEAAR